MMRDQLKSENYFVEYIRNARERISMFNDKLINQEVPLERIESVKRVIFGIRFYNLNAMYSSGCNRNELSDEFEVLLSTCVERGKGSYFEIVQFLAWSVLVGVDQTQKEQLTQIVKNQNLHDPLLDFLLTGQIQGDTPAFAYPNPYEKLLGLLNGTAPNALTILKDYLNQFWYNGHNDMGWYGSHKDDDGIYSGYWSFESAAIVKILGLNDESLKECQYYPYDAAHFLDGDQG